MKGSLVLFVALLALVAHSCKELPTQTEPPVALALSLIDSTCTDLELKLSAQPRAQRIVVERLAQPQPVIIFDAVLNTPDTMILDTGLLPNTTYTYRAYRLANNTKRDTSRALHARTMDTTSHNWTWTMQTFGDFSGSVFYDVAIINDTLAYAVGEIYLRDSLGQLDYTPYNLAIWNGQRWAFKKIFYSGNLIITSIRGIYVSKPNEIWLAGGSLFRWDGQSSHAPLVFSRLTLPSPNATVEKLWGNSPSNVYGVGNAGTILHYNGLEWRRVESGTSLDIYDVYGDGEEVLAVAGNYGTTFERAIIKLTATGTEFLSSHPISSSLTSIWFASKKRYYVVGDGIFQKRNLNEAMWKESFYTPYFISNSRGLAVNDVILCGGVGELLHFNGFTWESYRLQLGVSGNHFGVDMKPKFTMTVGFHGNQAFIAVGSRNQTLKTYE